MYKLYYFVMNKKYGSKFKKQKWSILCYENKIIK